jgi:hypothetical protein
MEAREVIEAVIAALVDDNAHQIARAIELRAAELEREPDPFGSREDLMCALAEQAAAATEAFFDSSTEPWHSWSRPVSRYVPKP